MIKSYDLRSIVFVIDLTKFTLESQSQWFNLKKFFFNLKMFLPSYKCYELKAIAILWLWE